MTLPNSSPSSLESPVVEDRVQPIYHARKTSFGLLACKVTLFMAILIIGGELVSRVFWMLDRKAPFWSAKSVWYAHYPQMKTSGVEDTVISNTDETYDILILGGSTISEEFGSIGKQLEAGLPERLGRPVRVFNLAYAAHNSRDSMLKHRWLAHQHFDLVVIYDGINDTRMNNAPPGLFRDDYSHCTWYKHLNYLDNHPFLFQAALPFTVLYTGDRVAEAVGLVWYLPRLNPRDDWMEHGKDVRTREPFQNNLREIASMARKKNERVVLMTFAYHIPANYSLEAFLARQLDYPPEIDYGAPVEIWGKPEHVIAALDQQNEAIRELAVQNPEAIFIDQQRLLPDSGKLYVDCCHFTKEGCTLFTQHILAALANAKVTRGRRARGSTSSRTSIRCFAIGDRRCG